MDRSEKTRPGFLSILLSGIGLTMAGGLFWTILSSMAPVEDNLRLYPGQIPKPPQLTGFISSLMPTHAWADMLQSSRNSMSSIVVDDFDNIPSGSFPTQWKAWRGDDELARNLYSVQEEEGNRYLKASDDGTSIIIRKEMDDWNPREFPILSWRWRARGLPENGDERIGEKNDSAVAVYVVLDQNFFRIPKTLKYVWSTTLPIGTEHRREGIGRPNVIVLETGPGKLGEWVTESVNVYEDFIRNFGKKPPKSAIGIGVLTDGNATRTDSQGDYDDFVIHENKDGS